MRSIYCRMLMVGTLKPWKTVTATLSLPFAVPDSISFSLTDFSRNEETSVKIRGVPIATKAWYRYMSESKLSASIARAPITNLNCKRITSKR
ncbi:hypothetical protein V6N11_016042 [Hibiscus sabdariffa]|uniref:Uncharacterized protein n=1 Tax=Hibiscus sabdariffa TaxID=183260 RepID=A0ABR2TU58_9ROSI